METQYVLARRIRSLLLVILAASFWLSPEKGIESVAGAPLIAVQSDSIPAPIGLVAWWQAEGNANDALGISHGTLENGAELKEGHVGSAFSFDQGEAQIRVSDCEELDLLGPGFTIQAWVKPSTDAGWRQIVSKAGGVDSRDRYYGMYLAPGNQLGFELNTTAGLVDQAYATLPLDVFSHVAVTYDGSMMRWFINAQPVAATPHSGSLNGNDADLFIGRFGVAGLSNFSGLIDEVALFNRALAGAELEAIYDAGKAGMQQPFAFDACAPAPNGLIAWWRAERDGKDAQQAHNGELHGGLGFGRGKIGECWQLDGVDDYVEIPDSPNLRPLNLTLEGWVQLESMAGYSTMIARGASGAMPGYHGDANAFWLGFVDGKPRFYTAHENGVDHFITGQIQIQLRHWYHLAGTFDGTKKTLYLNGLPLASTVETAPILYETGVPLTIGEDWRNGGPSGVYQLLGAIDEMAIYGRALSGSEIAALYGASTRGKCLRTSQSHPVGFTGLNVQDREVNLGFFVAPGLNFALEGSMDLRQWSALLLGIGQTEEIRHPAPRSMSDRGFYRIRAEPAPSYNDLHGHKAPDL